MRLCSVKRSSSWLINWELMWSLQVVVNQLQMKLAYEVEGADWVVVNQVQLKVADKVELGVIFNQEQLKLVEKRGVDEVVING